MNKDIEHLNKALKGEHMAIDNFDHFIKDVDDSLVKEEIMKVQRHHKNQAIRIAERIQQLGGNPINNSGVTGLITEVKYQISPKTHDKSLIMSRAIEGEKIGLDEFKKIEKDLKDEDNRILIKDIIYYNQAILDELISLNR